MPIFEFICKKCKKKFETVVLGAKEEIKCPECAGTEVEKQVSAFAASSSGSGCSNYDACRPESKHKCSGGCCRR